MRKSLLTLAITATCAASAFAGIQIGDKNYAADTMYRRQIGPGIVNTIIRIPDFPLNVYLLEADMDNPYNRVETMQAQNTLGKTESLVTAAKRYTTKDKRVLAGCNANFWCVSSQAPANWELGTSFGAVVRNDTVYVNTNNVYDTWDGGPNRTGATAIDHDKNLHFGHFTYAARVESGKLNNPLAIYQVNRRNLTNDMCLWNPGFGRARAFETNWRDDQNKTDNNADNYYIDFVEGSGWAVNKPMTFTIKKIVKDADRQTLGDYDACITATGSFKDAMRVHAEGDVITINQGWTTNESDKEHVTPWIENMVEGNAPVMHNGVLTNRNNDESYNSMTYSRTGYACDFTGRKLYMIVIDMSLSPVYGRSAGCSTTVMCQILKDLFPDVSEVINYDAGGSAQMFANGAIINKTTEGTPRSVASGWFIESIAPEDNEVASIAFADASLKLPIYSSYSPQIIAYNKYGDVINENLEGFTLSCDASLGTTSGQQLTVGGQQLTGALHANYNGMTADLQITTMLAQPAIALKPTITVDNQEWPLEVTATINAKTYYYDAANLEWNVKDADIAKVVDGKIMGLKNGETEITCKIGEFLDTAAVNVQIAPAPYIYQTWTDGWTLKGSGATNLAVNENGLVTFTYSSSRAPYVKLLKDLQIYGLPDRIGMTFTSTVPLDYIQIDARNTQISGSNYQKFDNGGAGYEANTEYNVDVDLAQLGGIHSLATYPVNIQEIRFVPNKTTTTAGEHSINVSQLFAHYPVKGLKGDLNGDGIVNSTDVAALVDILLAGGSNEEADINGDGTVNSTDVAALVNILLAGA